MAVYFLLGAAIGVWSLVYFNLRRTHTLFGPNGAPNTQLTTEPTVASKSVIEILVICLAILYIVTALCRHRPSPSQQTRLDARLRSLWLRKSQITHEAEPAFERLIT